MAENIIWGELGGTMRTRRCGASCSPAPDVGHFSTLGVMPGGLNLPCRGNNGGRTGQQGRAEDGCCGSGLAAQPLAARLRDDFLAEEKEVEVRVQ